MITGKIDERTQQAILNDQFRKLGFGVTITNGAAMLPDVIGLMTAIRAYDEFTDDNDPYHEHDFGSLMWHGEKVFWKIDYYDSQLKNYEDPLIGTCKRILTVMLAEEY
ncbi:MAG: DUF3768 domain-containing protein [Patescibacteria group bacterium]